MNGFPRMTSSAMTFAARQNGVALAVSLVLLLVATLLGIAGIQNTTLQERMSGNMFDRSLAMQAAEAALRAAESAISSNADAFQSDCSLVSVLCKAIPDNTFTGTSSDWEPGPKLNESLYFETQYHIQFMGEANTADELGLTQSANTTQYGAAGGTPIARFYRVIARSFNPAEADVDGRAFVVLTTTIRRNM